jgi:prepilin-type N-terminal cleavage/methylation domain-containing protein
MPRRCDGFTLIESIVAMGLVVTIALGSAQLFSIAIARNLHARDQLLMSLLAAAKVNDLAAAAADGTIALSPPDSLDRTADGCADTPVDSGRAYVRRWRISRLTGFGDDAVAIVVRVMPAAGVGEVRVATIREWWRPAGPSGPAGR